MIKKSKPIIFSLFLGILLIKIINSQQILTHCINGTRTILLKNKTKIQLSCIDCQGGEFTYYNEKENKLQCEKCQIGSSNNKNDIIINNFLSNDLLSKYSFKSFCSVQNDLCPKWIPNYFSIKVNYIESFSYKSYFTINQYFMNDGELIIKYINYNGGIDRLFNIYVNGKLSFTDDTNNNVLKYKIIDIKKGDNIFLFEYLVNEEIKSENKNIFNESFLEIFQISMKSAEISALNCEKYDLIEKLSENILNNCEFDVSKCNINDDYCTFRFYSEIKNDYCFEQLDSYYQEINYEKIKNAKCTQLSTPPSQNIICDHCSYGQYTKVLEDKNKICEYCQNKNYNSKEINDEFSCKEICDTENKQLIKIFYINNFDNPSSFNLEKIEIIQPIGYIIINYEKFNEKKDTIFFLEIHSDYTIKLINPNNSEINTDYYSFYIPLTYGEHSLKIKGSNLKLSKIIIIGSSEGGNYKCLDKININEEIKCENSSYYYSSIQNKCLNCPLGTIIDKNNKCEIYNQIINDKYTLDNNDINLNLFSKNYELDIQDIKYYLNINPTNPIIYMKNNTLNLDDENNNKDNTQIIGKELKKIKIVEGKKERGIILSFISEEKNTKTYVYIKCNPYQSQIYLKNISYEKGEDNDNDILANYFFVIESNQSCPYCLSSEVNVEDNKDSKCENGRKKADIIIKNNSLCVIKTFIKEEKLKLLNDTNILLNNNTTDSEEQMILKYFEINEKIPIKYWKDKDEIIFDFEKEIKCEEDNHKLFIAIIILTCFIVLIILGLGGVVIWKIIDNRKNGNPEINTGGKVTELSVISDSDK